MYLKCLVQYLAHSKCSVNVNIIIIIIIVIVIIIIWMAVQPVSSKGGRERALRIGVVGKGFLEDMRLEVDWGGRDERKGIRKAGVKKKHLKRSGHGAFMIHVRQHADVALRTLVLEWIISVDPLCGRHFEDR